jgi:phosphate:Na+ symporter
MLAKLDVSLLLGGLGLFIYAIGQLSATLQQAFTDEARELVRDKTKNLLVAIGIGTLITIALGSSSAAIILTIVFVNAGALDFRRAAGIVMGANIGTTFSSQLIALDVAAYSYVAIVLGLALSMIFKRDGWVTAGKIMLYLGLLFFGLMLMEQSVDDLKDSQQFSDWIARLDHPVRGALIGGLVTLIVQSSSATVGMAIVLGKQQLISVSGGLAVMLGAELGTCSDTLIATIGGERDGLKTGLFHLTFNFLTIVTGLLLFTPFVRLVDYISGGQGIDNQIANGHMLFNIGGVLLFLPFVGFLIRGIDRLLPSRD